MCVSYGIISFNSLTNNLDVSTAWDVQWDMPFYITTTMCKRFTFFTSSTPCVEETDLFLLKDLATHVENKL